MPRYNIEHKGKYYVFSSIRDAVIFKCDTFEELQNWRRQKYGNENVDIDQAKDFSGIKANKMEFKEMFTLNICNGNEKKEDIIRYFSLLDKQDMIEIFKELVEDYQELESESW